MRVFWEIQIDDENDLIIKNTSYYRQYKKDSAKQLETIDYCWKFFRRFDWNKFNQKFTLKEKLILDGIVKT